MCQRRQVKCLVRCSSIKIATKLAKKFLFIIFMLFSCSTCWPLLCWAQVCLATFQRVPFMNFNCVFVLVFAFELLHSFKGESRVFCSIKTFTLPSIPFTSLTSTFQLQFLAWTLIFYVFFAVDSEKTRNRNFYSSVFHLSS